MATAAPVTNKETAIPGGGATAAPGGGETAPGETAESTNEGLTDEEINSVQPGKAGPFDPDFILILAFAAFVDLALSPLLNLTGILSLGIGFLSVSLVVDIVTTLIIGSWIYWKSKQVVMPPNLSNKLKGMEKKVMAKIQAKIQKKIASKAMRRVLIRVGAAFAVESIPGASVFTSWLVAVFSML